MIQKAFSFQTVVWSWYVIKASAIPFLPEAQKILSGIIFQLFLMVLSTFHLLQLSTASLISLGWAQLNPKISRNTFRISAATGQCKSKWLTEQIYKGYPLNLVLQQIRIIVYYNFWWLCEVGMSRKHISTKGSTKYWDWYSRNNISEFLDGRTSHDRSFQIFQ